jgi:hypothetical protein
MVGAGLAPSHSVRSNGAMPTIRRLPRPTRIRALELLAGCGRDGCSEALMLAHGFTVEQMLELIRAGLATVTTERVVAGTREMEVTTLRITEAGRRALARAKS